MSALSHAFKRYKILLISLGTIFLYSTTLVFASGGPFAPGTNLDPNCLPTDNTCYVTDPLTPPAGATTNVQYNNAGVFGADSLFTRAADQSSFSVESTVGTGQTTQSAESGNLFGFGIPGIINAYSDNGFTTGFDGILSGDTGGGPATIIGHFDFGANNHAQGTFAYDAGAQVSTIGLNSQVQGGGQASINVGASLTNSSIGFDFGSGNNYSFPNTAPGVGQVLGYVSANTLGWVTGGGGAAGTTKDVQFNVGGAFAADTGNFTYDTSTTTLGVKSEGADGYSSKPNFTGSGVSTVLVNNPTPYTLPAGIAQDTFTVTVSQNNMQVLHFATGTALVGDNLVGSISGATGQVFQVLGGNDYFVQLTGALTAFNTNEGVSGNTGGGGTTAGNGTAGDTYTWSDTQGNSGSNIVMNGSFQNLVYGVQFSSDAFVTGHVIGDYWQWTTFRSYNGIIDNGLQYNINGNFFAGENINTNNISIGYKTAPLVDLPAGGVGNIFMGHGAGESVLGANNNTVIGVQSASSLTGGFNNTFLGSNAGNGITSDHNNLILGANANVTSGSSNNIVLGGTIAGGIGGNILIGDLIKGNQTAVSKLFQAGDWSGTSNNTVFSINDSTQILSFNKPNITIDAVPYVFPGTQAGAAGDVLANDGSGNLSWAVPSASTWSLTGNAGTTAGTNFIGTTDNTDFVIKTGNTQVGRFYVGGSVALGTGVAPSSNMLTFGQNSGVGATNASAAIMLGYQAGNGAVNAGSSVFMGIDAGQSADNADSSVFIGTSAGFDADGASQSLFLGFAAGQQAATARHSIFIGPNAGDGDTVDNSSSGTSILIGSNTSTGTSCGGIGCSNSIALGAGATNTAANQFMIGSATSPINTLVLTGAGGNTCVLDVTVASPSCSSDETLKQNITDLGTATLDDLLKVRTVSYTWKNYPDHSAQIGFLAQDLKTVFPSVVSLAPNGFETVSYGGMTPILTEAIRELNMKVIPMTDLTTPNNSFVGQLIAWLGSASNGITDLFAQNLHASKEVCVGDTCLTEDQVKNLIELQNQIHSQQSGNGTTSGATTGGSSVIGTTTGDTLSTDGGTGSVTATGTTVTTGDVSTGSTGSDSGSTVGTAGSTTGANDGSATIPTTTGDATTGTTDAPAQ